MSLDGVFGVLGFGNMGGAIVRGLLHADAITADQLIIFDTTPAAIEDARGLGARIAESGQQLAEESTILLIAVKPQHMDEALETVRRGISPDVLIVSVAAGITIGHIQDCLAPNVRVARVMPNTPALVGAGAAGFSLSENCAPEDRLTVSEILDAVGISELVPESAMDAVTALSGSGPAYCFRLVECMVIAAMDEGLTEEQATRLATQTLFGAGKLLLESDESPSVLRERVTSKGGTTAAALEQFQQEGFERAVAAGIRAAAARAKELGG